MKNGFSRSKLPLASSVNVALHGTRLLAAMLLLLPILAIAHAPSGENSSAWNFDPFLLFLLTGTSGWYARGWLRMRKRSVRQRRELHRKALLFAAGMLCLVAALISPLDAISSRLAAAHMIQHMLLIIAAAPLLVLSAPLPVFLWALPADWRRSVARGSQTAFVANLWTVLTLPLVAWLLHGAFLWLWHVPVLYEAALHNRVVHDLEHATFLVNALLFWWVVLRALAKSAAHNGTAVILLFTTFLHGGLLAALMTFSTTPWYTTYAQGAGGWQLSALEDQQLAGLIMWLPAGITYMIAGLILLAMWMRRLEQHDGRHLRRVSP